MNILLIDDHTLFRESLRRLLESEPGWKVTADFGSASAALAAIAGGLRCDIALIDFELEGLGPTSNNGLDVAEHLRSLRPDMPILIVTAGMGSRSLLHAVKEAKVGVFLKNEPSAELLLAMKRTARGELWVSSGAALAIIHQQEQSPEAVPGEPRFVPRERIVLRSVLEGLTNKEIAAQLDISESAVKAVLQKLFEKAGVRSRSQLVRFAVELQPELGQE
jgi:DNA-binding NarL/FixJ family response regulator